MAAPDLALVLALYFLLENKQKDVIMAFVCGMMSANSSRPDLVLFIR